MEKKKSEIDISKLPSNMKEITKILMEKTYGSLSIYEPLKKSVRKSNQTNLMYLSFTNPNIFITVRN